MKIHVFIPFEDLETIGKIIDLRISIDDLEDEIDVFLNDNADWDDLVHVTLDFSDFMLLSDSENINIK